MKEVKRSKMLAEELDREKRAKEELQEKIQDMKFRMRENGMDSDKKRG